MDGWIMWWLNNTRNSQEQLRNNAHKILRSKDIKWKTRDGMKNTHKINGSLGIHKLYPKDEKKQDKLNHTYSRIARSDPLLGDSCIAPQRAQEPSTES